MNKIKKILVAVLCVVVLVSLNFVQADSTKSKADVPKIATAEVPDTGNSTISGVTKLTDRIWASAILIVQVLSVGCVIFAGLRYMYSSADKKADIKKGMMYLALGAIFVFATSTVMKFIFGIGDSLIK